MGARVRRRRLRRWERAVEPLVASKAGSWVYVNVFNRLDPPLLRLSRGRLSMSIGQPVLLLTHTGAKSGQRRETPLLYATDGDRIVLVASRGGSPRHPAWYHNLRAHPQVEVLAPRGRSGRYVAAEAEGAERERLWEEVLDVYSGYETYQQRAGDRRIPLMVLTPEGRGE